MDTQVLAKAQSELAEQGKRKRRHYSMAQKLDYCRQWQQSGLNQKQFCSRHGIFAKSLRLWLSQAKSQASSGVKFLPVSTKDATPPVNSQGLLRIEFKSGARLCLPCDQVDASIARWLKVLVS